MTKDDSFDLAQFTPYLLNMASEATSLAFQKHYKDTYGMLRTEWRVLFHLGRYGQLAARDICDRAQLHKTKVSRAVAALRAKGFVAREDVAEDRRSSTLSLTKRGQQVYRDLSERAQSFDAKLMTRFSTDDRAKLQAMLKELIGQTHG
ncbi:MAG: MarR family transcriptional regulator [Pseudomonadota bacterium]